jgi:HD-GYP domain-containing protein (c-di-GMP phosphodiesterase class II)
LLVTFANQVAIAVENARLYEKVQQELTERKQAEKALRLSFIQLAETVSRAMESRDPYTAGHQRQVAELARRVGEKLGKGRGEARA